MKLFFILALLPLSLMAADYQWDEDACIENNSSMQRCSLKQLKFYDDKLNAIYQTQMKYLQAQGYKNALRSAQIAWIAFKDRDCHYPVAEGDMGTMGGLLVTSCKTRHTRQRIKDLESYVRCRDNGCPE